MTAPVISMVAACDSSHEVWDTLKRRYGSDSRVRILSLRQKLQMFNKGSRSVNDYLTDITRIADELSTAGDVTSERDLIIYTLSGLGEEYEAFVQTVTTREMELTFV